MKITAFVLEKNEKRFLWYAVMSVAYFVDEILLWDNGSSDGTLEVIRELLKFPELNQKIKFKKVETKFIYEDEIRQKMLEQTESDWILMVDGDEIWWEDSIKTVVETIKTKGKYIESIVVPTINLVGDMFHRIEEKAGRYSLVGRIGHLNLRAINRSIPGLASWGREWDWGWVDEGRRPIQDRDPKKILFINAPYLHATHLPRAGEEAEDQKSYRRRYKKKYEIGDKLQKDFYFPEVFFKPRPEIVPSPWKTMDLKYKLNAFWQTPLKKIKRRIL